MNAWSIYIDVEGFSARYQQPGNPALGTLSGLIHGVYRIGSRLHSRIPHRMFAYGVGDGLVVVGDWEDPSLETPLSVAVMLHRVILGSAGMGRSSIGVGDMGDISACVSQEVREAAAPDNSTFVRMGDGVLTIFPVMGTAFINAYKVAASRKAPSGALLLLPPETGAVPSWVRTETIDNFRTVDWIHSKPPMCDAYCTALSMERASASVLEGAAAQYLASNELRAPRVANTKKSLALPDA